MEDLKEELIKTYTQEEVDDLVSKAKQRKKKPVELRRYYPKTADEDGRPTEKHQMTQARLRVLERARSALYKKRQEAKKQKLGSKDITQHKTEPSATEHHTAHTSVHTQYHAPSHAPMEAPSTRPEPMYF